MNRLSLVQTRVTDDLLEIQLGSIEKKRRQLYATYLNNKENDYTREKAYEQWKSLAQQYSEKSGEICTMIHNKLLDHFGITSEFMQESFTHLYGEDSISESEMRERQGYKDELQKQQTKYQMRKMENKPVISRALCKKIFMRHLDETELHYERLLEFVGEPAFLDKYNLIEKELDDQLWVKHGVSTEELNYWTMHYKLTESEEVRIRYNEVYESKNAHRLARAFTNANL